jgi:hypothetical protein
MNKQPETRRRIDHQAGADVSRRNLLKLTGVGVAALSMMSIDAPALARIGWCADR